MILSACVEPVDINGFIENPKVQDIIETVNKTVKIDDKTGDNLRGFSGYIGGLKTNKYYMVEKELDANGKLVPAGYPMYVTDATILGDKQGPGGLSSFLGYITKIKDGHINGLIDYHTYTVRAAAPLSGNVTYTDDFGSVAKQIIGGVLNIDGIKGTGSLALSGVLSGTAYDVIAVYINTTTASPWGWTSQLANLTSFTLEGADTEYDYVFVNKSDFSDFKVLRVKIGPLIVPGSSTFNITLTITDAAGTSTISSVPASPTISRGNFETGSTLNISLSGTWDSVLWSVDGIADAVVNSHTSGNVLTINNSVDFHPALSGGAFDVIVRSAIKGEAYYTPTNNRVTVIVTD